MSNNITGVKTIHIHGPGSGSSYVSQNGPDIYVTVSVSNFVWSGNSASCTIDYIYLDAMTGNDYFGYRLEVRAGLYKSVPAVTPPSSSLFVKGSNPSTWSSSYIGKGTVSGTTLQTYNGSTYVSNGGSTNLSFSGLTESDQSIYLVLCIYSSCDNCSEFNHGNNFVSVTVGQVDRLSTPTLSLTQNNSSISTISATESVLLTSSAVSQVPDYYKFEFSSNNSNFSPLGTITSSNNTNRTYSFSHSPDDELSKFGTPWPRVLYFRVKASKSGFIDSSYSNVVNLTTLYNPIAVQSGTISYYRSGESSPSPYSDQTVGNGKFVVNTSPLPKSGHKGVYSSYDLVVYDETNNVELSPKLATNVSPSSVNNEYTINSILSTVNLQPETWYRLRVYAHYNETTISSSQTQYYNKYPDVSNDHPYLITSDRFKYASRPNSPEIIYPNSLSSDITYNDRPVIIFRVYDTNNVNSQIVSVRVTYLDGRIDEGTITLNGGTPIITDRPSNIGSFISIKSGLTSVGGYIVCYKVRSLQGSWFSEESNGDKNISLSVSCINYALVESQDTAILKFTVINTNNVRPLKSSIISASNVATLGNHCQKILDSYSKIKTNYTEENTQYDYTYKLGKLQRDFTENDFLGKTIYYDRIGEVPDRLSILLNWLGWMLLPESRSVFGTYGIYDKLVTYTGVRNDVISYDQVINNTGRFVLIMSNNLNSSNYYVGNIFNCIIDILKNMI